jgi:hypothetical protein
MFNSLHKTFINPSITLNTMKNKSLWKLGGIGAVIGSLCCITPIVVVLFGLGSVSFAAALGNTLYFQYRWAFLIPAFAFIIAGLVVYFRNKGICSLDQAKRNKKRIINITLITIFGAIAIYLVFNYVILEYIGYWLGIWKLPSFYPGA